MSGPGVKPRSARRGTRQSRAPPPRAWSGRRNPRAGRGHAPAQAEQALRNIAWALAEAGSSISDVVRVRYILPDRADFEPCWPVLKRWFGEVRPAATMFVAGLADPRMKIEIEVTARRPGA
ncbi:MAG: Rid family hydrolase [Rhodospirillales bacterium]|nr:Rid family hydrolase [Rhodospirillales bacterium]